MKCLRSVGKRSQAAIVAGLGLAMALAPVAPAFADTADPDAGKIDTPVVGEYSNPDYETQVDGRSDGDTSLYVIGQQSDGDLTTSEGAVDENVKVSIPVAIHYVADTEGNLVGPSDNVVKFVNHTKLGAVHVSKIAVENTSPAHIVKENDVDGQNDYMSLNIRPMQGQSDVTGSDVTEWVDFSSYEMTAWQGNRDDFVDGTLGGDELGNYVTTINHETGERGGYTETGNRPSDDTESVGTWLDPTDPNAWNIAQKEGALILNDLDGTIGGFGSMNPATDTKAGTIHWMVRAGTRAQADAKDTSMTLHFNSNNGSNANCTPVGDQTMQIMTYDGTKQKLVMREDASLAGTNVLRAGTDVTAPRTVTNADGTQTTYTFQGWSIYPDAAERDNAEPLTNAKAILDAVVADTTMYSDIESYEDAANTTIELFAFYEASTL